MSFLFRSWGGRLHVLFIRGSALPSVGLFLQFKRKRDKLNTPDPTPFSCVEVALDAGADLHAFERLGYSRLFDLRRHVLPGGLNDGDRGRRRWDVFIPRGTPTLFKEKLLQRTIPCFLHEFIPFYRQLDFLDCGAGPPASVCTLFLAGSPHTINSTRLYGRRRFDLFPTWESGVPRRQLPFLGIPIAQGFRSSASKEPYTLPYEPYTCEKTAS